MKSLFAFSAFSMSLALFTACASSIPYSNEEYCAVDHLKFSKIEKTTDVIVRRAPAERMAMVTPKNQMRTICEAPQTAQDKHHVEELQQELQPKIQYNQSLFKTKAEYDHALSASNEILHIQLNRQATFPRDGQ